MMIVGRRHRSRRGFTLIELTIAGVIIGVLAVLATVSYRRWVRSSHISEAQDMISQIRSAEERFRAEYGGYLTISSALGPGNDYPNQNPGAFKTAWGASCSWCINDWSALTVRPSGPVVFGYSLIANNTPGNSPSQPTYAPAGFSFTSLTAPWYIIEADAKTDGPTGPSPWINVFSSSASNYLTVNGD